MTTSVLSPLAGELRGHDIQVVRDYALEAPWEWQKALRALCDAAEHGDKAHQEATVRYRQAIETLEHRLETANELLRMVANVKAELREKVKAASMAVAAKNDLFELIDSISAESQ